MNILIPNSWLKDYLETNATPQQFADAMSLTSISIERINKIEDDYVYDIEVTTNRPDLMSVEGIAREASAVLPQAGYKAKFKEFKPTTKLATATKSHHITIHNDPELVNRITAIVMDVKIKPSPKVISERLEKTGIRSINNVIDVTNYIMRELGHPVHAFDYDRLTTKNLLIRLSKKGEKITTLDDKEYTLPGGDIIADDGNGKIVDLLGIMGLSNSSITDDTKRVLLFIDNNNPQLLRKTSMNLGIRTEAAVLNEKGVDPEKMIPTLLRGVELLEKIAEGKAISDIIDIYPNTTKRKLVSVAPEKINSVIGIELSTENIIEILTNLGFTVESKATELHIEIPSARHNDIEIEEDIIEEVARVYGYHKIPNLLPQTPTLTYYDQEKSEFYWIKKVKEAFKYWGFNETYTYSMVGESLFDGPIDQAVKLKNPLDLDHEYMRNTLIPSLVSVANENKSREEIRIFEISNVYIKKGNGLPDERLHLGALLRREGCTFYEGKGIVEQIFNILGIQQFSFIEKSDGIEGAVIQIEKQEIGSLEIDSNEITLELDFSSMLIHCTSKKKYLQPAKYPAAIEDVRIEISDKYTYAQVVTTIKSAHPLVKKVSLLDMYKDKKTFRIVFADPSKNLTTDELTPARNAIHKALSATFKAKVG